MWGIETAVRNDPARERYEISAGGAPAGFAAYRERPGAIAFVHTEVDERFEGQGLGGILARHALDDARERGLAVFPFCPFVRGYIQRHAEYVDLVPADSRAEFGMAA